MNILLSCAGRRNYLVRFFQEALGGCGKVVAADMNAHAPAMAEADVAELVPEVYADNYINRLLEICEKHDIKAIIPLNDLDLPILAASKKRFMEAGVVPIVSDPEVVATCFDKWQTHTFLQRIGLRAPKTYLSLDEAMTALNSGKLCFPLVVKPRWGAGSIGVEFVENQDELAHAFPLVLAKIKRSILNRASQADIDRAVLIQEKFGGQEYGIDIVNDLNGHYAGTITKKKLAMRAGETDKAETIFSPALQEIGQIIGTSLKHIANLDCDIFEKNGKYYVLELNPRFGGGYPFSQMAGADIPRAILDWLDGHKPEARCFQFAFDQAYAKCDTLVKIATLHEDDEDDDCDHKEEWSAASTAICIDIMENSTKQEI